MGCEEVTKWEMKGECVRVIDKFLGSGRRDRKGVFEKVHGYFWTYLVYIFF
jgi:hypothetical protein